jgi:hypothetical protein
MEHSWRAIDGDTEKINKPTHDECGVDLRGLPFVSNPPIITTITHGKVTFPDSTGSVRSFCVAALRWFNVLVV